MKVYIYRAYLPSGMSYIGCTNDLDRRKYNHFYYANIRRTPFHIALMAYGKEAWTWEVLEEVDKELGEEREVYWTMYFDSVDNGFNVVYGNRGRETGPLSDEHKMKISNSMLGKLKGRPRPEAVKQKIRESLKRRSCRMFCRMHW